MQDNEDKVKRGKCFHLCQSVEGPLSNWTKREWNHNAKAWTLPDGSHPTGQALKDYFIEKLGEGYKVLPMCKCENFDKENGCMGWDQK